MTEGSILIKACLNGARGKDQHPEVPITPEELAEAARAAVAAGAAALHIHPRDAAGAQTVDGAACGAAIVAVRRAAPGVPVGVTTGAWIEPHPGRLATIGGWQVMPDFASVNFSEDGADELCDLLARMGIPVEGGVFNMEDTRTLIESNLADGFVRILVEVGRAREQGVAAAAEIDRALDKADIRTPRLHHGGAQSTWDVLAAAIDLGREIRIGLEDTLVLPDGSPARDNADLVAAAAQMVRQRGRQVTRPRA